MLKTVDILIGVSVIMLVVSMSVTLIIQWILQIIGLRGKELLKGLTALLQQIDPQLETHAKEIATEILKNRMLARGGAKLAGVVQREELIKTVLEIAARVVPPGAPASPAAPATTPGPPAALTTPVPLPATTPGRPVAPPATVATEAEQALAQVLAKLGIPDPGNTLNAIRDASMRLEAAQPELATHVREAKAVIEQAGSQFVARVNGWFDPTMDRVSQSFTTHSRYWTAGISLLLALLLQIDTFQIVNRLSIDDALRASLLGVASQTSQANAPAASNAGATADQKALEERTQTNMAQLRNLASDQLLTWPTSPNFWWEAWDRSHISIFGVLLSAVLLSFGAPFWFNMLGELLKLRPMLASKEDQQRKDRETSQTPKDGTP